MKITAAELEELPWRRKKRRYAQVPDPLKGLIITELGKAPSPPPVVTRVLGTWVFEDDEPIKMLPARVHTEVKIAIQEWVDRKHGGGIGKAYREVTELQWDGEQFWMVTF